MSLDLSSLEHDYQILTELHRSDDSHTFLARHLGLNRDVTITVVEGANVDSLRGYDADASRLIALRHPHVIPVIEGRWLGDHIYAIVHARVRGSTLDQLVSAVGGMPLPRTAAALEQVYSALDWARESGIVNRHVTPDELIFQQGSGRVLLALTPTSDVVNRPISSAERNVADPCVDARTVGELAFMMLSGHRVEDAGRQALATLRPDLPPAVIAQTETLLRCDASGVVPDVAGYIAQLAPLAARANARGEAQEPAFMDTGARRSGRGATVPVPGRSDTFVTPRRDGMGFGARFLTALLVLVVMGAAAMLVVNRRAEPDRRASIDTASTVDTGTEAAGEIALHARQSDSMLAAKAPSMPHIARPAAATPAQTPAPMTSTPQPDVPVIPAPETRRHEPPRATTPPLTMPDSAARPPRDSTPVAPAPVAGSTSDVCDSPNASDQHRCLMDAILKYDASLNDVYQKLIAALRRQANVQPEDPDPASVETLRGTQRRWIEDRDTLCRTAGSGALYARDRAACFAGLSDKRARALQQMIDALPPV
jgi:uncharacterized protein YecT (DUF1311 family)